MEQASVLAVTQETHDTVSVRLATPMRFLPGQFVMLGAHLPGLEREVRRSYSVSSAYNGEWLEITVKRQEPGFFSHYLHLLKPGDAVLLYGPFGKHFLFEPHQHAGKPVVFIAGGSGIAPFRSMLQAAAQARHDGPLTLLFGVKTSSDVIFRSALESLAQSLDLRLVVVRSRPSEEELAAGEGPFGRINAKLISETLGETVQESTFYLCGPTPLVVDCQRTLAQLGVPANHVKTEKFGLIGE